MNHKKTGTSLLVMAVIVLLGAIIYKDDRSTMIKIIALGVGLAAYGLFLLFYSRNHK